MKNYEKYDIIKKQYTDIIYPINPIFNNDIFMLYLMPSTCHINYEHQPDVKINITTTTHTNIVTTPTTVTKYKLFLSVRDTMSRIFYIYYDYSYIAILDKIITILIANKLDITKINYLNVFTTEKYTKNLKLDIITNLTNKYNNQIDITNINLLDHTLRKSTQHKKHTLYYLSMPFSLKLLIGDTNIFNIIFKYIINLIANIQAHTSVVIMLSFENRKKIVFDFIQYCSEYFTHTYVYKFKYISHNTIHIILLNRNNITVNTKLIDQIDDKSYIKRLYQNDIISKYNDIIKIIDDNYDNIIDIYMLLAIMKLNNNPDYDKVLEKIKPYKYMFNTNCKKKFNIK